MNHVEELRSLLSGIAAAVDKRDQDGIAAAYHPDSRHRHGDVELTGADFAKWAVEYLRECISSRHEVSDHRFTVDGTKARGTSKFVATELWPGKDSSLRELRTYRGSYSDEYVLENGKWRVLSRQVDITSQRTENTNRGDILTEETRSLWLDLTNLGFEQRFYDVGGVRTRTLEAGSGRVSTVLLHGSGGHAETWVRNLGALAEYSRVIALDMIGHGFTDAPTTLEYTTAEVVAHVVDFIRVAKLGPVNVIGESFGGRVGAWLAMDHPELVRSLVLNTTGGLPVEGDHHQQDVGELLKRSTAAITDPTRANVEARVRWLFADQDAVTDELVRLRQVIYQRPEVQVALTRLFSRLFDRDDLARYVLTPDRIRRISAPTLVVWSDSNPLHGFDDAQRHLKHIPDVRFELISGAGHWPHYERPEEFNRIVTEFFVEAKATL
ncbi:alpha/beta fold hydrolase [Amycolatopsis pithecellobii]|uniref:Alpha/beta fold hydrolase n=1 Tax=Amycolatopsis pithecellobii TaxID=664692 RepID=A0A6N7YSQ7_9PSEU|nr:alpha/beta fold hydrolase [Amycolatopsis pithecellobii]MTD56065.1 alpha/beta fold hydrolase [Amycolatopsis pithecellobii]